MRFDARFVITSIPIDFRSDGCSGAPDVIFGYDISDACRAHDAAYCERLWPPNTLNQAWRKAADYQLGIEIRSYLPYVLDWIGWLYFWAVHRFGGDEAFEACDADAGEFCRHGMPLALWQRDE